MTAYREDALDCANVLASQGAMKAAAVRDATGVLKAANILRDDVYGWFEKVDRGTYAVAQAGRGALAEYSEIVLARENSR